MLDRARTAPAVSTAVLSVMLGLPATSLAQLEEIIVTARKRAENLQEVPVSVSILSAEDIERRGIRSLVDVVQYTASVEFDEGFAQSDTRAVIRGLSAITGRQNAAVLVDGIDVSTESISSGGGSLLLVSRLVDIERVEIVKGPQMVQYGRSAFNGAIQYVTKDPAATPEAEFGIDGNEESQYNATASVSGPLFGDALGARLSGSWWDEDGIYENSITGEEVGGDEGYGLALTLRSQPAEDLFFKFRTEYQDSESQPSPVAYLPFNAEIEAQQAALDTGVMACFPAIMDVTHTPALDDRTARIYDPAFPNPTGGNGPYCETPFPFVSGRIPDATESQIRLASDPFHPGRDFEGADQQTLRVSLVANWDLARGSFTSWTGYLHDDTHEAQDAGEFGVPGPAPYLDDNVNLFMFEQDKQTRQISQELRYATRFDGPVNVTLGGLYWEEDVDNDAMSVTVQGSGSHCFWNSSTGVTSDPVGDGSGCPGYTEIAVAPFIGGGITFGDGTTYDGIGEFRQPSPTDRDTEHRSFYGMLELDLAPAWTLTLEGRYNDETVDQYGPVFLNPAASGGTSGWTICGIFFRPCTEAWLSGATGTFASEDAFKAGYDKWNPFTPVSSTDPRLLKDAIPAVCQNDPAVRARLANIEQGGTDPFDLFNPWCKSVLTREDTWFSPKMTLDWDITDEARMYVSWARAQKPGGFATGTIGSNGLNREISEFEPEKMDVYEIGAKTEWFDTVIVNGAVFLQDYTDKQTVVSTIGNEGRPVAKIDNATAAEIWGAELETQWLPADPFLGGQWAFTAAYTWLDSEYVDAEFDSIAALTITMAGNCEPTTLVSHITGDIVPACRISYTGNSLEGAPDGKFVGSVRYSAPVTGELDFVAEADIRWTDKRFVEVSNRSYVDAYSNTDLRLGVQSRNWEVTGYVTNVFDEDTVRTAFSGRPALGCCFVLGSGIDIAGLQPTAARTVMVDLGFTSTAIVAPPRIFGVRASYRFGGEE